jgi:hypothetical protein
MTLFAQRRGDATMLSCRVSGSNYSALEFLSAADAARVRFAGMNLVASLRRRANKTFASSRLRVNQIQGAH